MSDGAKTVSDAEAREALLHPLPFLPTGRLELLAAYIDQQAALRAQLAEAEAACDRATKALHDIAEGDNFPQGVARAALRDLSAKP